ncbi:unnamed protein product [Symbiodinium sp. CCMP2456]|nr:unnamed protein product [Symbiodinium sp. CCMP2456]
MPFALRRPPAQASVLSVSQLQSAKAILRARVQRRGAVVMSVAALRMLLLVGIGQQKFCSLPDHEGRATPGRFPTGLEPNFQNPLLGALALLRDPAELDGEGLGRAATAAAREGLDDEAWWAALTKRTKELSDSLAMHDVSLILNGMARSRRLDKQLVQALLPRICANLVYLTSAHLAMLASSVAKAEIHNAQFTNLLTRELKAVDTVFKLQLLPYLADGFKLAKNDSQDAP